MAIKCCFDARGLQSTTLSDVANMLESARREVRLSQDELAQRAGGRTIVARMDVLKYLPGSDAADFISLTMPVPTSLGSGRATCIHSFARTCSKANR